MKEERRRVLVLDGDQASSYAIVRSLARHGLDVCVADCLQTCLASKSRQVTRSLRYPAPKEDPQGFIAWLRDELVKTEYAYVIL